ncbi:hypothetical protein LTR78_010593 [Recurvomyces mirabilis]|uniref:Uncharacterized protein n=2 Tax=Recurvomyces mirabilis TaxID=574656 RepID=A0AAE0TM71_9PEZI|nr:hypothetical protein LTR78_010593 [Recurvomyces mirabilis]
MVTNDPAPHTQVYRLRNAVTLLSQEKSFLEGLCKVTPPYNESEKSISLATVCEGRKQEIAQHKEAAKQAKHERDQEIAREKKAKKAEKAAKQVKTAKQGAGILLG